MSIRPLIEANIGNRLHLWEPLTPGSHVRVVYVEDRLWADISKADDYRFGLLWSDLDHFSLGGKITVGYGREATCFMKQLDPRADEVWEIRSKDPTPQIRVFGRFCASDELVVTHAVYRDLLGNPAFSRFEGNHWPQEIQRCKTYWDQILQGHPPHSGNAVNAYITSNVVEVGRIP